MMKFYFIALLLIRGAIYTQDINWIEDPDKAFDLAQKENKSVYVLITAPSWCHWCKKLEEDVLTDSRVIEFLNENYISLMLLDRVDGKPNPNLLKFIFEGYPTQFIYDSYWGKVKQFSTFNSDEFITLLSDNRGKVGVKDPQIPLEYKINNKLLIRVGNRSFAYDNTEFTLITRDLNLFYIFNRDENLILFIPYNGGTVLAREFNKKLNDWGPIRDYGKGER